MRILYLITFISLSFSSTATVTWSELQKGNSYQLAKSFQLKMKDRSGSYLEMMRGDKAKFLGEIHHPESSMRIYQFKYKNCSGSELETGTQVVQSIQASGRVVKMNAQLNESCLLQFFVEGHDGQTNSIFY